MSKLELKKSRPSARGGKQKNTNFGLHLMIDGYFCDPRKLNDFAFVARVLKELPGKMGMRPLIPPYVVEAGANDKKDPGGFSGFIMIQESHISVHTFPRRRFVSIDLYSCKNFRLAPAVAYFKRAFGIGKLEVQSAVRGTQYPSRNLL